MKRNATIFCIAVCLLSYTSVYAQLDQLKKALGSIAGIDKKESSQLAESINWKPLSKLLPKTIDGYTSSKLDGGTFKTANPENPLSQFDYSSVSKTYTNEKKRLKITILDSGYNQLLLAPFMMSYEYDGPQGYMKSIKIGDHNAKIMTELDDNDIDIVKTANLMVAVKDRVLVMFEGRGGVTVEEIKKQSEKMQYDTIEKLIGETEKNIEKPKE